jgi:hypothetical protein
MCFLNSNDFSAIFKRVQFWKQPRDILLPLNQRSVLLSSLAQSSRATERLSFTKILCAFARAEWQSLERKCFVLTA